jgi:hypothetical protein
LNKLTAKPTNKLLLKQQPTNQPNHQPPTQPTNQLITTHPTNQPTHQKTKCTSQRHACWHVRWMLHFDVQLPAPRASLLMLMVCVPNAVCRLGLRDATGGTAHAVALQVQDRRDLHDLQDPIWAVQVVVLQDRRDLLAMRPSGLPWASQACATCTAPTLHARSSPLSPSGWPRAA